MPQNNKDSQRGKNKPVKDTASNGGKRTDKGAADRSLAPLLVRKIKARRKLPPDGGGQLLVRPGGAVALVQGRHVE